MPQLKIKTSWDLSSLASSDNAPEINKKLNKVIEANNDFIKKWKTNKDYLTNPSILKQALDDYENLKKNFGFSGDPGYYFYLKYSLNQSNPEIKAKFNKIEELEKELQNKLKFFTLNISKIPEENQKQFLQSVQLKEYRHFLERLFAAGRHLLSEKEEKILNLKETTSHDYWERMTSSLLTKQEKVIEIENKKETKNFSELLSLVESPNQKTRKNAAQTLNEILSNYAEIAEPEINAILTNKKVNDELRKFTRPDEARHLEDDISTQTVDILIQTISENFQIAKKFYELKAKLLKLPKIKYYERNTPVSFKEESYPFEESKELVQKTFQNIDKEFSDIFVSSFKNSQVDVFPKKGKQNGAFCVHLLPIQPTFVLLNHTESLKDVTTIAHEFGHAINYEFMKKSQNALNSETPKSTAEVASTFFEDFVLQELLKNSDDETKLEILMEKLNGDISSVFRQTAFYNFETELHRSLRKKGYLSKEEIGKLFKKHMISYMGDFVDCSDSENHWIYVPHFRYMFYVYSYVSGLLISKELQSKVKQNPQFIKQIKEFLSAGTSDSPENIFKNLGIDITKKQFWQKGINEVALLLQETEALAKKLRKIKNEKT